MLQAIKFSPVSADQSASLEILDQLLLPHQSAYVSIETCEDAFDAIKQMKVRGAPAIAIVAALALAVEIGHRDKNGVRAATDESDWIIQRLQFLKTSRPTAVNLGDAVNKLSNIVRQAAKEPGADALHVAQQYVAAAERMLVDDVSDNMAIGANGAKWIMQHTRAGKLKASNKQEELKIMTICNTGSLATAGYGTALGVVRSLYKAENLDCAYCLETRPYNQGSRLTAYELVHDAIPATLITDSMAASLLLREGAKISAIVVGADRVAANGDTANKIGTYSLAVLAKHHNVKFLVAAPRTTIDLTTASGKDIVIEERASDEVTRIKGPRINPDGSLGESATINIAAIGIDVWNPAFDVTPAELIDGVVTEVGVVEKVHGAFDFRPIFAGLAEEKQGTEPSAAGNM